MAFRILSIILLSLMVFSFAPSYSMVRLAVYPPISTTWSGNDTNGSPTIQILGALPGDWKENNDIVTAFGSYSNRTFFRGIQFPYMVEISLSGNLMSATGDMIPASSLLYMVTYIGGPGGESDAIGTKTPNYRTYVPFSTSWDMVYTSGPWQEYPTAESSAAERESQFKYAIKVPNNQPPGIYTGTVQYRIRETAGSLDSKQHSATISVTVDKLFRLSVDRGSADFEKMRPGETKDNVPVEGIIATSQTNAGDPWYLKISNDSPLSSSRTSSRTQT